MKVDSFCGLVDQCAATASGSPTHTSEEQLLAEISKCFKPAETGPAKWAADDIVDALGVLHACEGRSYQPYLRVAKALQQALRTSGTSTEEVSDWTKAAVLAHEHAANHQRELPVDQIWIANQRVCTLSAAIKGLRDCGYRVNHSADGGVDLPDDALRRIAADIDRLASSLGSALAESAAGHLQGQLDPTTGRFPLGRPGQTVVLDAKPQLPLAYLYHLGLRYLAERPTAAQPEKVLQQLCQLVTLATGLLDLTINHDELVFAREPNLIRIVQRSAAYDAVFTLAQAKHAHAREYLVWLMAQEPLSSLKDKQGRSAARILQVALAQLDASARNAPDEFLKIEVGMIARACSLDTNDVASLLLGVFTHAKGANQSLTFPPKDTEIDAAFRPLIHVNGIFVMQPGPVGARAMVNAVIDWCRVSFKKVAKDKRDFDDKVVGPLFEQFAREKLQERRVSVSHGKYEVGASEGECDAVVETGEAVIFIELKSKMLTRAARSLDDVQTLKDLGQAVVRPQAQAMERHAVLKEHQRIELKSEPPVAIELKNRKVIRLSITRGELGSLHDGAFLRHFLLRGCYLPFSASDAQRQGELADLHTSFSKLNDAAVRVGEFKEERPFTNSISLSIFQLLVVLERTTDTESFARELLRTSRIVTPTRDFYAEFPFMLQIEKAGKAD